MIYSSNQSKFVTTVKGFVMDNQKLTVHPLAYLRTGWGCISRSELAVRLGVPFSMILATEKGFAGDGPSYRMMKVLMVALNINERESLELVEGRMSIQRVLELAKLPVPVGQKHPSAKRQTRKQRQAAAVDAGNDGSL